MSTWVLFPKRPYRQPEMEIELGKTTLPEKNWRQIFWLFFFCALGFCFFCCCFFVFVFFLLFFFLFSERRSGEREVGHILIAQHCVPTAVISWELSKKGPSDSFLLKPEFSNPKPTSDWAFLLDTSSFFLILPTLHSCWDVGAVLVPICTSPARFHHWKNPCRA